MRYYILSIMIILISCDSADQVDSPGKNYFVKFYGEDGNHEGVDFVADSDGSFILLGNEIKAGASLGQQLYLVKVDELGTVVWQKYFGSSGDDFAKDIELTDDGNIIVAAESKKANDKDVYLISLTKDGVPLDSVRVGLKKQTGDEGDEEVNSISIISNGFLVLGSTTAVRSKKSKHPNDTKDALHLRFTNGLDLIDESTGLWKNSYGFDDSEDVLVKMIEVNPSTYYGFGYTNTLRDDNRDFKYWAFSLGATGEPTNNGTDLLDIIGSPEEDEMLSGVIESPVQSGEGFVLSGVKTNKLTSESQSFIVKLQKNLFVPGEDNVLAEESPTELGTLVDFDENTIIRTRMQGLVQGGFLLLTNNKSPTSDVVNISLIKLSNTFKTEGRQQIFFGGVGDDFAGTVTELPDGKIMVMGTMTLGGISGQKKMMLMKLNKDGKLID
jgi:hypothetical protein